MKSLVREEANGTDWVNASKADRDWFCKEQAPGLSKIKPITAQQLRLRLDTFFKDDDEFIRNILIVKAIGAVVVADS